MVKETFTMPGATLGDNSVSVEVASGGEPHPRQLDRGTSLHFFSNVGARFSVALQIPAGHESGVWE
jgi:hypothetical protein